MSDSTNKTISDHEKRKQEHEEFRDTDPASDREREATRRERQIAEDVTEAPRQ